MIRFEKVSFKAYKEASQKLFLDKDEQTLLEEYEMISLPKRATKASAGYDFSMPFDLTAKPQEAIFIPTGIRLALESNLVCLLMPRSSLGMKYGMALDNTIGVIDADYYYADNEGHIMAKITFNKLDTPLILKKGERFMQGLILPYYVTDDDSTDKARSGGFGSTGK